MAAYFEALKPCVCEIHKYVTNLDKTDSKKSLKCTNIFKRMMLAYTPLKQ